MPILSILVPVFNERERVEQAIKSLLQLQLPYPYEVIVIDDGSTDGTSKLLERLAESQSLLRLLSLPANQGKGAAIRAAIPKARGKFCLIQDADLEYNPGDIISIIEPLLKDHADVVYGSRFQSQKKWSSFFLWHALGNRMITLLVNTLTNLHLTDVEVGYKAFRTSVLQSLQLRSNGFEFEIEVTIKAARRGCLFYEVPISYHGRTYVEGKKITWRDGVKAIFASIYFRFFDFSGNTIST